MPSVLLIISTLVVLFGSLYQLVIKEVLFDSFGIGRSIHLIEDFPYSCRRLQHQQLEACEDLWLDEQDRILYAACTGTNDRLSWNPAMDRLNQSGRRPGGSQMIAISIDSPGQDGLFDMHPVKSEGYSGEARDSSLNFLGFDAAVIDPSTIHFYMVNQRPPVDANNQYVDATNIGVNATIEIFVHKRGSGIMRHVSTIFSPEVWSPNRVAILPDGAFVVSNDHSVKIGFRRKLDPIIGGATVAYCSPTGVCHRASTNKLKFPNGLAKGPDGLIYVPGSVDGTIGVFELQDNRMLKEVDVIRTRMPLDNLAFDANGDLFAAGLPDIPRTMSAFENPYELSSPATVFRIRKIDNTYHMEKILEDVEGKVLSGVTTAVHDAKTGRLFLGSAISPYMMVCDPK
ncbi:hypothetical protein BCR34DRAFT_616679 [Clohesyomyces aquaticus]|uniref:Calcium-dependent phosphotriesterase n=1 Tax=Clohesyomyces aquaticus TaxID=1231657 RepID=A0A1Y1ZB21_9PLEO|nr:hypothetical protein BCR34DRAFT_616679 [Clohesyomyces aquaticus]